MISVCVGVAGVMLSAAGTRLTAVWLGGGANPDVVATGAEPLMVAGKYPGAEPLGQYL